MIAPLRTPGSRLNISMRHERRPVQFVRTSSRPDPNSRTPAVSVRAAPRDANHHTATAAVLVGLVIAGLCGAVLNRFAGPVIDSSGMLLAAVLYGVIGFSPFAD